MPRSVLEIVEIFVEPAARIVGEAHDNPPPVIRIGNAHEAPVLDHRLDPAQRRRRRNRRRDAEARYRYFAPFIVRGVEIEHHVPGGVGEQVGREMLRSEEHTSELQSLMRISYAVFCLKKKKTKETTFKNNSHKETPR